MRIPVTIWEEIKYLPFVKPKYKWLPTVFVKKGELMWSESVCYWVYKQSFKEKK